MAQLIFYDQHHLYEVDGEKYDSVSEVIRFLSREEYDDINQYTLDNAAERGKAVHKACEVLYKYGKAEVTADIEPYVTAFLQFLKDNKCEFADIEKPVADTQNKIAGTPDYCGTVNGTEAIVDVKAQSAIKKTLVKAQLNGYRRIRVASGHKPAKALYCLQLLNTGKYRCYPVAVDESEWAACLTLHRAAARVHGRGKID